MYYHFAFLAISIALFGLSASGVYVYLARARLTARPLGRLLAAHALVYTVATAVALACLVRLRVGLSYSADNLARMLMVYALAALPFFTGGAVISAAMTRLPACVNLVYAADLVGAATGCVLLIPLLNALGAPGVVLTTTALRRAFRSALRSAPVAATDGVARRAHRGPAPRGADDWRRVVRCRRHEGTCRRPCALQQVEFVFQGRRLRPAARRLVLEPPLLRAASRDAFHGHRLGGLDAHPPHRRRHLAGELSPLRPHLAGLPPEGVSSRQLRCPGLAVLRPPR